MLCYVTILSSQTLSFHMNSEKLNDTSRQYRSKNPYLTISNTGSTCSVSFSSFLLVQMVAKTIVWSIAVTTGYSCTCCSSRCTICNFKTCFYIILLSTYPRYCLPIFHQKRMLTLLSIHVLNWFYFKGILLLYISKNILLLW